MVGGIDTLVREVAVYDGTGAAPITADVALQGDRIAAVFVNGVKAIDGGRPTGARSGRVLRRAALTTRGH